MFFGDFVQTAKHNWQNFINILLNQTKNIFIIPEVQCPFCNLKRQLEMSKLKEKRKASIKNSFTENIIPENENWIHTWISA